MEFRIADTFTDSLDKLTGQEQKAVKTTAFDLQLNPAHPSLQFHRIERSKDANFWSVRVNSDIRIVLHRTESSLLLCYVAHHDDAYHWATLRKIERHPRTGAAQLVEIRERVEEIPIYREVLVERPAAPKPLLFARVSDDALMNYGVPEEWLADVRQATEDTLFGLVEHLPQESAEALLELAVGGTPVVAAPIAPDADPFAHPDAQRRFRVLTNQEELERALEYPWEKWTVFLHPAQRHLVEHTYNGPARASGSAGTGKTVVALHRAVYVARQHPTAKIVVTTFSDALANALNNKLLRLIGNNQTLRDQIQIYSLKELGTDLYSTYWGPPAMADEGQIRQLLRDATKGGGATDTDPPGAKATGLISNTAGNDIPISPVPLGRGFDESFLFEEWTEVVDAWQLDTWEQYRDVPRLGRKTRLGVKQREVLWQIFQRMNEALRHRQLLTWSRLCRRVTDHVVSGGNAPVDFLIVDESQDVDIAELRMLAALGASRPDGLFFAGDLGQRIFQQPYSWKQLGIEVRGRSHTLTINYRTSHQIRHQADRLLPPELSDVDGNVESRRGTISVFNGVEPTIATFDNHSEESVEVSAWIVARLAEGINPAEIGVFVRSTAEIPRALEAVRHSGSNATELDDKVLPVKDAIAVSTMHLAKGLEFRAVVVMACDNDIIPLQSRIESVVDMGDLEEVYNTERHLLYVACTRARDYLLVTGVEPASEFLDDLRGS